MKSITGFAIVFCLFACLLGGCGNKGIEKLSSCGECVQGLQELSDFQALTPLIDGYRENKTRE